MDKYDRRKRIALCVGERGTWWDVEPGTNPGFLCQQNTLRDAKVDGDVVRTVIPAPSGVVLAIK